MRRILRERERERSQKNKIKIVVQHVGAKKLMALTHHHHNWVQKFEFEPKSLGFRIDMALERLLEKWQKD